MLKLAINRNNNRYLIFPILLLSIFYSVLISYASFKVIVAFSLLPVLIIFYINTPPFAKIILPIIMITFPITLQFFGKDALSTGTFIILITFTWSLTKYRIGSTIAKDQFLFALLFFMICIASIGMLTKTPQVYLGPAVRHYINFISSIAVFILIIHSQHISGIADSKGDYIEKIITTLLIITVIHVFLSFIILSYPWVEQYLTVFLNRTQENLGGKILDGAYVRATSVFIHGEEFGELLILLFPFVLYKAFASKEKFYFLITVALLFGTLLSGTRSAFFLIIFQILVFVFILAPKRYSTKKIVFSIAFVPICILMLPVIFKYGSLLIDRVQETLVLIGQNEDLINVVNRSMSWPLAYELTMNTISFFGHGALQAHVIGFPVYNFHCLYLSLLFQFGIIGTIVFLMFFVTLAKRLLGSVNRLKQKKGSDYLLIVTCLLSLTCFLINEVKFEFNRSDSYQQFVWCVFSVVYLSGRLLGNNCIGKK